jgi:HemY protein
VRRLLIYLSLALLVGAALYQTLARANGYLLLSAGDYVVETSLWGALVMMGTALMLIYALWRLIKIALLPRQWWQSVIGRKIDRNRTQTVQGMLDYIDGNWPRAIDNLRKGVKRSQTPALNYLGAAAASFNLGDDENTKALLTQAEENGVADSTTISLLRARMLLQNSEFEQALTILESLDKREPGHPSILRLLAFARRGLNDWRGLESMLPELAKSGAMTRDELGTLEHENYRGLLAEFGKHARAGLSLSEKEAELNQLWNRLSKTLQQDDTLMAIYINQLHTLGLHDKAEARLRRFLGRQWSELLVDSYGRLGSDPAARLVTAEAWLREHPESPGLLHALGRICVQGQLWGKARDYFESAIRIDPSPDMWLELGELLQVMQDPKGSYECFRKGLSQVVAK